MKPMLLSFLTGLAVTASAQERDSVSAPLRFGFVPELRSAMFEASSMFFFAGVVGPTLDVDLIEIPYANLPRIGVRLAYQEFHLGFLRLKDRSDDPSGKMAAAFLRGSHRKGTGRLDVYAGFFRIESNDYDKFPQLLFGADIRVIILDPVSSVFVRVLGNNRGAVALVGITLGYIN